MAQAAGFDDFQDKPSDYFSVEWLNKSLHSIVCQLELPTEISAAEKLDDLIFEYIKQIDSGVEDEHKYRFLQVKHSHDGHTKMTYNNLTTTKHENKFCLGKSFWSYFKIKQIIKMESIENFIIRTNMAFNSKSFENKDIQYKKIEEKDEFFEFCQRYKLIVEDKRNISKVFMEMSDMYLLAQALLIEDTKNSKENPKQLDFSSEILKYYHEALIKENVIEIVGNPTGKTQCGKFSDNFNKFTTLSKGSEKLRESLQILLDESKYPENPRSGLHSSPRKKGRKKPKFISLEDSRFEFQNTFGEHSQSAKPQLLDVSFTNDDIDEFLKKLIFAVTTPDEIEFGERIKKGAKTEYKPIDDDAFADNIEKEMRNWVKYENVDSFIKEKLENKGKIKSNSPGQI